MLKENPRYDYAEAGEESAQTLRTRRDRSFKPRLAPLPVRDNNAASRLGFNVPLQTELQRRFPHFGGKDCSARSLRAENQRRYDLCVARGNNQLSRTSGDWHPITPAEISAALAALEIQRLRETATPR